MNSTSPACDVFVAGLGVMGSAAAHALARAGLHVVACDERIPPHDRGSSHGESRIIRAAYFEHPLYAPLARRAAELWRGLEQECGRSLLRITGGLNIGPVDGTLVSGALASARQHAIPHEVLSATQLSERFPGLRVRSSDVAVFEPDAGILNPEECVAAQLDAARRAGAELHLAEPLVNWRRTGTGFRIDTAAGSYRADTLVLALGPWLPAFRARLPLQVARQAVFWFAPATPQLYTPDRLPHYLIEFEPNRVFYGFPDLGSGVKCAIHHEGERTTPDLVDRTMRSAEYAAVSELVARFLPGALGELRRFSVCLYTNTPDLHFLLDQDRDEAGVWLMSACSGHGFKFAPAVAELLVESITNTGRPVPELFAASRLA
ncbi:MAG TPA: N-methyl-L-tryptophan oxidase [Longimicrobiales bacterium]|nr:N-methyl-L-tryptophan oxidase [Longimicrobiales bacterium]